MTGRISLKKINDLLAGVPMTVIGGIFLIISLVLPRLGMEPAVDPAWLTVVISGIPLLYLAVWRILYNPGISKISSALLITIAMFAALVIGDLFAAGEVAFIMAVGAILEERTTDRAKKGLKQLVSLAPVSGRRLTDGGEETIPASKINCGDLLRVLPGERIPADGRIVSGETSVDQSIMTGESLPVDKGIGEEVYCGTINRFGVIDITATKVGADSSLKRLIRLVQEAEEKQAPMQRIADRCASYLVPAALLIAVAAGLVTRDIVRAVTVLVVFCPCALVLATPTAIMAAIGQASKYGVIVKSGEALEKMGKVDTIAFDKTGTLTYGRLDVCDVCLTNGNVDAQTLLSLAASAEAKSEHPIGQAIAAYARERNVPVIESACFKMYAGKGVLAEVSGKNILCGSERFLEDRGITIADAASRRLEQLRTEGKASVLVADEEQLLGILALADVLRPEAEGVITELTARNTTTLLLTGDHRQTAEYFAKKAGIGGVCAELLPEEKVRHIERLQADGGHVVCMVGDGVNDAPALKTASVGVAMGSMGSDIAVEAADIALMSDDISRIPYLKWLADTTVRTIKLSITLSMCINFLAVTLSVMGVLNPTTGALVHNAGSCLVVLIAALLYDRKYVPGYDGK